MDARAKDAEEDGGYGEKDETADLSASFLPQGFRSGRLHATVALR